MDLVEEEASLVAVVVEEAVAEAVAVAWEAETVEVVEVAEAAEAVAVVVVAAEVLAAEWEAERRWQLRAISGSCWDGELRG